MRKFLTWTGLAVIMFTLPIEGQAQSFAAGCFASPAKLGDDAISSFLSEPASVVNLYPNGGFDMVGRIRSLAGSSAETIDPLIALIPQFSPAQRGALGTGLARVARACVASTPEYAQIIQEKVVSSNSPEVTAAFLSALEEVQTAALGAAGGAAGAAGGVGGGAAGGTSAGLGGDSSVATIAGDFTVGSRSRSLVTNVTNISRENAGTSPF